MEHQHLNMRTFLNIFNHDIYNIKMNLTDYSDGYRNFSRFKINKMEDELYEDDFDYINCREIREDNLIRHTEGYHITAVKIIDSENIELSLVKM